MLFVELRTKIKLIMKHVQERSRVNILLKMENFWEYLKLFAKKHRASYYYNLFH